MSQPEQLGKYTLLEKIGMGGMAEVWLARATGPGGFAKGCVVKMVRPGVDQARFSRMFMDEARLAALLNHPNIVQLFDFGEHEGRLFIAMEFIHGRTLRQLMKKLELKGMRMPLDHAARILIGVLSGLTHAHSLADEAGVSLHVIHRDVSPENVMITYAGVPRLLDFGIAKATLMTDRTRDGRAKGKLTYMAPEQLMGSPLDHRVDLYACGVVLYELVCGRHPFPISNAEALARAILDDAVTPPQKLDPSVPDELSDIMLKALAKRPEDRFSNAQEMHDALDSFVHTLTITTGFQRLDSLVSQVWSQEMEEDAARARRAAGAGASTAQASLPPRVGAIAAAAAAMLEDEGDTVRDDRRSPSMSALSLPPGTSRKDRPPSGARPVEKPATPEVGTSSMPQFPPHPLPTGENLLSTDERQALDAVFSAEGGIAPRHLEATGPMASDADTPIAVRAPSARDGPTFLVRPKTPAPPSETSLSGPIFKTRMWHVPRVVGVSGLAFAAVAAAALSGATFWVLGLRAGAGRATPSSGNLTATLTVEGRDGCAISVDGTPVGKTPLTRLEVTPGAHTVQATCGDVQTLADVSAQTGRDALLLLPPTETPARKPIPVENAPDEGYLVVVTRKPGTLYLDGKKLGDIPQKPLALPPGNHQVRVVTRDKKDRSMTVELIRGKTATARFQ
jgi:serine/threonine-protein kinase